MKQWADLNINEMQNFAFEYLSNLASRSDSVREILDFAISMYGNNYTTYVNVLNYLTDISDFEYLYDDFNKNYSLLFRRKE